MSDPKDPFRAFDHLAENGLEPPAKTAHEIAGWIVLAIAVIGIAWAALRALSIAGPLMLLALAAGLYTGSLLALARAEGWLS